MTQPYPAEAVERLREALETENLVTYTTDPDADLIVNCDPADLAALLSYVEGMKWRPIESAPRDSSARLIWVPNNLCTYCVTWRDGPEREGWELFGGGWRDILQCATHWLPLPPPPDSE